MNNIATFVQELTSGELEELAIDYEQFEAQGSIGDCALRRAAETIATQLGTTMPTAILMNQVAFETYRELCSRYRHRSNFQQHYV